jgi:hypothetical protein
MALVRDRCARPLSWSQSVDGLALRRRARHASEEPEHPVYFTHPDRIRPCGCDRGHADPLLDTWLRRRSDYFGADGRCFADRLVLVPYFPRPSATTGRGHADGPFGPRGLVISDGERTWRRPDAHPGRPAALRRRGIILEHGRGLAGRRRSRAAYRHYVGDDRPRRRPRL